MVAVHDTILVRPVSALDFQNACCRGSSTFWFRSIVYPLVLSFRPRLVKSGKLWWAMYSVFIGILDIQCHYRYRRCIVKIAIESFLHLVFLRTERPD